MLEHHLAETNKTLLTATAERVGWSQGEAQCLTDLLTGFREADKHAA